MTQDEIIEMAVQAGFKHPNPHDGYMGLAYDRRDGTDTGPSLEIFAKLVAAKEREACAKTVEKIETYEKIEKACFKFAAKTIRARGKA